MLDKKTLEMSIENAIKNAMIDALKETFEMAKNSNENNSISQTDMANAFANKAKTCASGIADAIDAYIKSAQITIPMGTIIKPAPGTLISPAGPVTGAITVAEPTTIVNGLN